MTILSLVHGTPATDRVMLGIRTSTTTSVRIKVGTNSTVTTGVVYSAAATPDAQGYSKCTALGLTPGVRYYYQVEENGALGASVYRCRTAPATAASFAFAMSGCLSGQNSSPSLTAIANLSDTVHFFVHNGDYYYENDVNGYTLNTTPTASNYRSGWQEKTEDSTHQAVMRNMPLSYIWSDHDGALRNNGTGGTMSWIGSVGVPTYRQCFPVTNFGHATSGIYHSFTYGRCLFIQADTRTYKSANSATDNSSKTILGTTQKAWLKDLVTNWDGAYIFITFDQPWIGARAANDDEWFAYDTERQEIGNFLRASGKQGMILGGDMHALAIDDGSHSPGGWPVFHASPLHNDASHKGGPYSIGPYPADNTPNVSQYGTVTVTDTGGSSITIKVDGYSSSGTNRMTRSVTVPASATTTPTTPTPDVPASGVAYNFEADSLAAQGANGGTGTAITATNLSTFTTRTDLGYSTGGVLQVASTLTAATSAAAVSAGAYFSFAVNFGASAWTPGRLQFRVARGNTSGVRGYTVRSSIDNYAANLATADLDAAYTRPTWQSVDIALPTGQQAGTVTFRIYPHAPAASNTVEFDGIVVTGTPVTGGGTTGPPPSTPVASRYNPGTGAAGVNVSIANSDDTGGTAWTLLSGGGDTNMRYLDADGSLIRIASGGSVTRAVGWDDLNFTQGQTIIAFAEIERTSIPGSSLYPIRLAAGSTTIARAYVNTSGVLNLDNPGGSNVALGNYPIGAGTKALLGLRAKLGPAGTGELELRMWADPTKYTDPPTMTSGVIAVATATNNATEVRYGNTSPNNSGTTYLGKHWVTDAWPTGTTAPPVGTATVTAGANRVAPAGSRVSLSATGTPSGGTYSWSRESGDVVTLVGGNTATPYFDAPVNYTVGETVLLAGYTSPAGAVATPARITITYQRPDAPLLIGGVTSFHTLDYSQTAGTVAVVQYDGPPVVSIVEDTPKVFTVDVTGVPEPVVMQVTATANGVTSEPMFVPLNGGSGGNAGAITPRLVYDGVGYTGYVNTAPLGDLGTV